MNHIESSANQLAHQLQAVYGLARAEIQMQHVHSLYRRMSGISVAADFSCVPQIINAKTFAVDNTVAVFGLIIETRKHTALEAVVLNIIDVCGIRVQLLHGRQNKEFILASKLAPLIEQGQIVLTQLDLNHLDAKTYNALLLSRQLYESMLGRKKFLVFQTDSLCCAESEFTLQDFMMFDYIGGSWDRRRPAGLIIDGGNGGFSLRDWRVSTDCLSRFSPTYWGGGEDGYYAFHMELVGGRVASDLDAAKFATQQTFRYKSFGAHAIGNLKQQDRDDFFRYSLLAKTIFPDIYSQTN